MLFAVSDAVTLALIGLATVLVNAVTVIATMIIKDLLDQRRAVTIKDAAVVAAGKVETKLIEVTAAQNEKLDSMAANVETVRHATNSLTDRLVSATEAEALARGGVEERARADERTGSTPATGGPAPAHITGPVNIEIKGEAEIKKKM